jgi:hypothetical protein
MSKGPLAVTYRNHQTVRNVVLLLANKQDNGQYPKQQRSLFQHSIVRTL